LWPGTTNISAQGATGGFKFGGAGGSQKFKTTRTIRAEQFHGFPLISSKHVKTKFAGLVPVVRPIEGKHLRQSLPISSKSSNEESKKSHLGWR